MALSMKRFWWFGVVAIAVVVAIAWTTRRGGRAKQAPHPIAPAVQVAPSAVSTTRGLASVDPAGTLRLEGLVLDASDQPVPGVEVTIDAIPTQAATTEQDGTFAFENLLSRHYSLVAVSTAGVAGPTIARLSHTSEPVVLRLRPAAKIEVAVVDAETGRAVEGATVEARGLSTHASVTDRAGMAVLSPLVPGVWPMVIRASGYATGFDSATASPEAPTQVAIMLRRGARVRGRVTDTGGAPIVDAIVWAEPAGDWLGEPNPARDGVRSGAAGTFELGGVARGTNIMHAMAAGHAPGSTRPLNVEADVDGVVVALGKGVNVSGRVTRPDGEPSTGAVVRITWPGSSRIAHVDRQGRFVFAALPRVSAWITARDTEASSKPRQLDESALTTPVELVLEHDAAIAGVVVDEAGEPVEGAQVVGRRAEALDSRFSSTKLELTDAAGGFVLRGLVAGTYRISAARDRRDLSRGGGAPVLAATGRTDVRLTIETDGAIEGRVTVRNGNPPASYSVRLGRSGLPVAFRSDRFKIAAPPGRHALWIEGPGFTAASSESVEVKAAATRDVGTIVLERGRVIRGRVTDPVGGPAANAEVVAGAVLSGTGTRADVGDNGADFRSDVKRVTTQADGTFVIQGAAPGAISVVAVASTGRSAPVAVPAGSDDITNLALLIRREVRLSGVVSLGGKPSRAIVNAQSHASPLAMMTVMTNDGTYAFDHLVPGKYTVAAVVGDPYSGSPFYPRVVDLVAGAPATLDLAMTPGPGTLTVQAPGVEFGLAFVSTHIGTETRALPLVLELGKQDGGQWAIAPVRDGVAEIDHLAAVPVRTCVVRIPNATARTTSTLFEQLIRAGGELTASCSTTGSTGTVTIKVPSS